MKKREVSQSNPKLNLLNTQIPQITQYECAMYWWTAFSFLGFCFNCNRFVIKIALTFKRLLLFLIRKMKSMDLKY